MTGVRTILLVMSREVRQRLRSKGFFVFTALLCAGIITAGVLNRTLHSDSKPVYAVALAGDVPDGLADNLSTAAKALGITVRLSAAARADDVAAAVRSGQLDAVIDADHTRLISNRPPPATLAAVIDAAWRVAAARRAAAAAGLDPVQIAGVVAPPALTPAVLQLPAKKSDDVGRLVGTAAGVLLFVSINAFGGMVLTGVVEEKSTGVVEVLLSHVRAHQLLAGKVFGIGVVAMTQFCAAVAAGVIALRISGTTVPTAVWFGLPSALFWFVVGFVLYSTLFALAGSFVSRQEDAQGAAAPISMVFTAAYITMFALGANPSSTTTRVVSLLPPFAPLLMPLRIATGSASATEIIVAASLLLLATFAMLRLAGAVYARTLLHRGSRLKWGDALRMTSS